MSEEPAGGVAWGRVTAVIAGVLVCVAALYVVPGALTSFKGVPPDQVCVVQEGGLFDGRDIKDIRQPSSGVTSIGIWNHQRCFPATERYFSLSRDPREADTKTADDFKTPSLDAVEVFIEGQARFTLTTDPDKLSEFYRRYGVRTFDGEHPYDGSAGWDSFLFRTFRPVLQNTLRESIGKYRCVELNNTCQYVQNVEAVTQGEVDEVETGQNLAKIGAEVGEQLERNLNATLGGEYFENVRFSLIRVSFEDQVEAAVTAAQTKRTEVASARLDAQKAKETARGKRLAAEEEARAIREKQQAYATNPTQGDIDKLKAICGDAGCAQLKVLGADIAQLIR